MPFYEYQCEKCSEIYEIFIRNGEKIPESCEVCGGKLHKIISASTFHLKGSGWYMTDYSRKNSPKERYNHSNHSSNNETASTKNGTVSSDNSSKKDKSTTSHFTTRGEAEKTKSSEKGIEKPI